LTLNPGARLSPYEVTTQIGTGGMGEVYRAIDSRLGWFQPDMVVRLIAGLRKAGLNIPPDGV